MSTKLLIDHPKNKPYGPLRNDYRCEISINNVVYKSPLNYTFSNLIPADNIRRMSIMNADPDKAESYYMEAKTDLDKATISTAIKIGLSAKMKDENFKTLLAKTKGKKIIYLSQNFYLGSLNAQGLNIYGLWLEQIRDSLPREALTTLTSDQIYDAYLAEKGLLFALQYENLNKYLSMNDYVTIIKTLASTYGGENIFIVDKKTAIAIHAKRNTQIQTNPSDLIRYVRKKYIREIHLKNCKLQKNIIFNTYVDFLIREETDINKEYELSMASLDTITELISRTYKLFKLNKLPSEVMNKANKELSRIYIPSDDEIKSFEADTVPIPITKIEKVPTTISDDTSGYIWIYPNLNDRLIKSLDGTVLNHTIYDMLSPNNDSNMLFIEDKLFPSISHYVIVKTVQLLPEYQDIGTAYTVIWNSNNNKFYSIIDSEERSFNLHNVLASSVITYLKVALAAKFSMSFFKDILLSTNNRQISFNFKGVHTNLETHTLHIIDNIRTHTLPNNDLLLDTWDSDPYIQNYIKDKLDDILFTVKAVQIWLKYKNINYALTNTFVSKVVNTFYSSCAKNLIFAQDYVYYEYMWAKYTFKISNGASSTTCMSPASAKLLFSIALTDLSSLQDVLENDPKPKIEKNNYSILFKIALINLQWIKMNDKLYKFKYETNQKDVLIVSALLSVIIKLNVVLKAINKVTQEPVNSKDVTTALSILAKKFYPLENKQKQMLEDENLQVDLSEYGYEENKIHEEKIIDGDEEGDEGDEIDYADELPDFDEEVYYEGLSTIPQVLKEQELLYDNNITTLILEAVDKIKKIKGIRNRLNFYGG